MTKARKKSIIHEAKKQQIVISGVGGQGVLFVTRLLAEAAIRKSLAVFTSETHGMAQRGGAVLSHIKVGTFSSPLIRPGHADGMLALKAGSMAQHGFYLKPGAWVVLNSPKAISSDFDGSVFAVDADRQAQEIENPKSVNLILLGAAVAASGRVEINRLFCGLEDIRAVLDERLRENRKMREAAIRAIEAGYESLH